MQVQRSPGLLLLFGIVIQLLIQSSTQQCQVTNCELCDMYSLKRCSTCEEGYRLVQMPMSSRCTHPSDECLKFEISTNTCKVCAEGYRLSEGNFCEEDLERHYWTYIGLFLGALMLSLAGSLILGLQIRKQSRQKPAKKTEERHAGTEPSPPLKKHTGELAASERPDEQERSPGYNLKPTRVPETNRDRPSQPTTERRAISGFEEDQDFQFPGKSTKRD